MATDSPLDIPIVDLAGLDSESTRAALSLAFGRFGLVYLRGHGITPEALNAYYDHFLAFTARPEADKRRYARADIWYQRGWTPPNTEHAVLAEGQPDFKECYFASATVPDAECAMQYPEIYAPNVWPDDAPAWPPVYLSLAHQLHAAGIALLQGCAQSLGLPSHHFTALVEGGPHVTRALRYLPLTPELIARDVLWGEEHTDFNLVTLLPGGRFLDPNGARCPPPDANSGLYLRTRPSAEHPRGQMVFGRPPEGCIVAQVGQQLEILTGGTFLATPHVITAPRVAGYSRLSCAHFVHTHPHQTLFPIERFRTPETVRAYSPPVLAGTYDLKTLVDIHLAPPSALDQLGYRHYDRLRA